MLDLKQKKINRLNALVKVETLTILEVQAQKNKIIESLEVYETEIGKINGHLEVTQMQVRHAMSSEAYLDLHVHLLQQKKIQKLEAESTTLEKHQSELKIKIESIEAQLSDHRAKIKGFERLIDRYKVDVDSSEQLANEKAQDGIMTIRAGVAAYG